MQCTTETMQKTFGEQKTFTETTDMNVSTEHLLGAGSEKQILNPDPKRFGKHGNATAAGAVARLALSTSVSGSRSLLNYTNEK